MGLFSEMLDDEKILRRLEGSNKILILTCPGCSCESLSYSLGLPNRSLAQGKNMEESAVAIHSMRLRWEKLLRNAGKEVRHISIAFPCEMYETDRELIRSSVQDADTVAILACSSGFLGIRDMFKGVDLNFVPMMKTSGTFVFKLITDESGAHSVVDKSTARIVRFSESANLED